MTEEDWMVTRHKAARKTAIILLAGPGMADQPLPSWPLSRKNRGDEHLLAAFCEYLGINEASYAGLRGEMWSLTTTRKFELLFTAITTWLKRRRGSTGR